MKTFHFITLSSAWVVTCALAFSVGAAEPQIAAPAPANPNTSLEAPDQPEQASPPTEALPLQPTTSQPADPAVNRRANPPAGSNGARELRLNFRNAPLETVLNYLSEAAGFIIDLQTDVKGRVNVWSNQPVTREEALDLLNSALDRNGYTAVRNGRTLTIWSKDEAKKRDLPVRTGNEPDRIPKTDEMVTQIIPVRYISAVQVARDLQPLLPDQATLTANEGGNALILTDTQVSIRRMAEIIRALDTAVSSVSSIQVFPLTYADAKAVATVIKELFAPQETTGGRGNAPGGGARVFNQFRGPGGGGPGGQPGGGASASGGRAPTPRVVAVAEERSNSVVVSAPSEQMPIIQEMIREVDEPVEDITELRVFRLIYADAQETADLLNNLFADTTSNTQGRRGQMRFAGGRRNTTTTSEQSTRMLQQTRVVAVPDLRTGSVVVSASRDLMDQIASMIAELDSDASKKQEVFVFDVQNTDPQAVQDILQSLFPSPNYGNTLSSSRFGNRNQTGAGNQLNNRASQNQNRGFGRNTGFGNMNTGFGGGTAFGR